MVVAVALEQLAGLLLVAVGQRHQQLGDHVGELGDPAVESTVLVHRGLEVAGPAAGSSSALRRKPLAPAAPPIVSSSWLLLLGWVVAAVRVAGVPADLETGDVAGRRWSKKSTPGPSSRWMTRPPAASISRDQPRRCRRVVTSPSSWRLGQVGPRRGVLQEQRSRRGAATSSTAATGCGAPPRRGSRPARARRGTARLGSRASSAPASSAARTSLSTSTRTSGSAPARRPGALVWRIAAPAKSKAITRWPWRVNQAGRGRCRCRGRRPVAFGGIRSGPRRRRWSPCFGIIAAAVAVELVPRRSRGCGNRASSRRCGAGPAGGSTGWKAGSGTRQLGP